MLREASACASFSSGSRPRRAASFAKFSPTNSPSRAPAISGSGGAISTIRSSASVRHRKRIGAAAGKRARKASRAASKPRRAGAIDAGVCTACETMRASAAGAFSVALAATGSDAGLDSTRRSAGAAFGCGGRSRLGRTPSSAITKSGACAPDTRWHSIVTCSATGPKKKRSRSSRGAAPGRRTRDNSARRRAPGSAPPNTRSPRASSLSAAKSAKADSVAPTT